jgi:predicted RNA-binding protein YlqC (UPF0109 family)
MSQQTADIAGLVRAIVEPLVEHKDDVEVRQSVDEYGNIYCEVSVNDEDTGKVIGRQGRVIKSIRTVARAAGSRVGAGQVDVELPD